jgi:hypothetical protein
MEKAKQQPNFKVVPKRTQRGRFAPITFAFTTRLSLEECIARLEAENRIYRGRLTSIMVSSDGDTYKFRMLLRNSPNRAEATGMLQRWEGTATLVTGRVSAFHISWFELFILSMGPTLFILLALSSGNLTTLLCFSAFCMLFVAGFLEEAQAHRKLVDLIEAAVAPEKDRKRAKAKHHEFPT